VHRRTGRRIATAALALVFVVAFLAFTVVIVVRSTFLSADYYTDALAENDIYDRVYTELLADPELADVTRGLLGDLPLDPSVQEAVLRFVLPPDRLRGGVELTLREVLAYFRGDKARLEPEGDVTTLIGDIEPSVSGFVQSTVAELPPTSVTTLDALTVELDRFAGELAEGRIPEQIPELVGSLAPSASETVARLQSVVDEQFGPDLRMQIEAALAAGDVRGAVTLAATEYVEPHLEESRARLRDGLERGDVFDVVAELADAADERASRVVEEANTIRSYTERFSRGVQYAAIAVMIAVLVALALVHRGRGRAALLVPCAVVVGSGVLVLVLWGAIVLFGSGPLDEALLGAEDGWGLPRSLRAMIGDIRASLGQRLWVAVRRPAIAAVVVGVVVGVVVALTDRRLVDVRRPRQRRVAIAVGGATALLVLSTGITIELFPSDPPRECNGHPELCDRRYDDVVFAASHNSMSSADLGWIWPQHDGGLGDQLDFGVRALLIDTHHWQTAAEVLAYQGSLPPQAAAALDPILGRIDPPRDGTFLCHNLCQLGATPLVDGFTAVRRFLDDNPDEVVTLFIQDAISPDDTAGAMRAAGLLDYVHVHEAGARWLTLGEMIDRGERLFVMAESNGPPPPWYHQGFELTRETPYEFHSPEELSCAPNRGQPGNPLFLMNHWVTRTAATRADAGVVNERDFIVRRARECRRERGDLPNYIAVDFYASGDLIGAVDTLNGV
jgi:hypothetical protein